MYLQWKTVYFTLEVGVVVITASRHRLAASCACVQWLTETATAVPNDNTSQRAV